MKRHDAFEEPRTVAMKHHEGKTDYRAEEAPGEAQNLAVGPGRRVIWVAYPATAGVARSSALSTGLPTPVFTGALSVSIDGSEP